jgi:Zn-dependent protease with chaperone function
MIYTKPKLLLPYFFCALLLLFTSLNAYTQNTLVPEDSLSATDYVYNKTDDYKIFLKNIAINDAAPLDKKIRKQYLKYIQDKNDDLIGRLNGKEFLFDSVIYPYLYSVFKKVVDANGLDINTFHFLVSRSAEVNANTYEDGTIICNLGLLNVIENESQLAMVFSHELSHYLLKHGNTALIQYLETLNSDELLDQLKDIQKNRYNTKEQIEGIQLSDVFNRSRHSRYQETAADSLGMLLFSKTAYNCNSLPRLFDLFDSSDVNETPVCTMRAFCQQEGIMADDNWFVTSRKMSFGAEPKKEIIDSLETHPDCAKRKIATQLFFTEHPKPGADFLVSDLTTLQRIKNIALFDEATYSKNENDLGLYLYQLIQNDALFPSNKYIKTEIFNTLLSLCEYQQKHILYKVVITPYTTDNDKDEYAKLLKILDQINLRQLIKITGNYYDKNKELIHTSIDSINQLDQLKKMYS